MVTREDLVSMRLIFDWPLLWPELLRPSAQTVRLDGLTLRTIAIRCINNNGSKSELYFHTQPAQVM